MMRANENARGRLSSKAAYRAIPFALLLLAAAALFHFSVEVGEGDTLAWDQAFLLSLRHADDVALPLGPAWITTAMVNFTSLGGVAVLLFITLTAIGLLLISHRPVEAPCSSVLRLPAAGFPATPSSYGPRGPART